VVDNQTAKLIDFGLTNHADYFKTMDDKMLAQAKYQFWPAVLTRLFNIPVKKRQAIDELDDIVLDIDKHGFAVMLIYWLQYTGLATPTWQLFKDVTKQRKLKCVDMQIDETVITPRDFKTHQLANKQSICYDPYYDAAFYSWQKIYENLQRHFRVKAADLDSYKTMLRSRQADLAKQAKSTKPAKPAIPNVKPASMLGLNIKAVGSSIGQDSHDDEDDDDDEDDEDDDDDEDDEDDDDDENDHDSKPKPGGDYGKKPKPATPAMPAKRGPASMSTMSTTPKSKMLRNTR
jgi:hypothetical protein